MPDKNSHANHNPIRTCVVCKKKVDQKGLLNFFIMNGGIVFDFQRFIQVRKNYLCPNADCFTGLDVWRKRYQRKHKAQKS